MLAFAMVAGLQRQASRPAWWWTGAGVLPALLPWFHPRFSVLAAALGAVVAGRALRDARPARAIAVFIVLPAASAIGWFGYYYAIYGRLNPSVAYGHYTQMSLASVPAGLLGLLFDQQYGLIVYAPVFAVGLAGLVALARSHRRVAIEWAAVALPYTVVTAMYHMWWGGFSSPARFIGPTLLLFALPLAAARASATCAATRAVQAVALGVSAGIAAMLLAVEGGAFVFNVRDIAAPWLVWASQLADLTRAVPSLFRHGPAVALAESTIWTAAVAGAWIAARAISRARRWSPGSTVLFTLVALGVTVTAAAAGSWRIERASGTRITPGQLRAIEAAGTRRGVLGVLPDSPALAQTGPALERLRVGSEPNAGAAADTWLSLSYLPAGRYRLWADFASAVSVELALFGGRSAGPFDSWLLAGDGAGAKSRDVVLPVGLSAVRVRGDAGAKPALRAIWLQPAFVDGPSLPAAGRRAGSACRYAGVAVYALGNAYLEPDGLWTAGGQTAELVLQVSPGGSGAAFTLRAGPVTTPVQVRAGSLSLDADLAAGDARELDVPISPQGTAVVTIRAGKGFRPSELDPSSADRRLLGVRLEPRR
jgi:hypothetical protein